MYIRIFQQRTHSFSVSAKLNVSDDCAQIIESEKFWPLGVYCRKWVCNKDGKKNLLMTSTMRTKLTEKLTRLNHGRTQSQ